MAIKLKTGSGAPALGDLINGEVAIADEGLVYFRADDTLYTVRPLGDGSNEGELLFWDASEDEWLPSPDIEVIDTFGLNIKENRAILFNTTDASIGFDGDGNSLNITSGGDINVGFLKIDTNGDLTIDGRDIYTDAENTPTLFNAGFDRINVLTQAEYDALTPDAETLYFIKDA